MRLSQYRPLVATLISIVDVPRNVAIVVKDTKLVGIETHQ